TFQNKTQADKFSFFLLSKEINGTVREAADEEYAVWVFDESKIGQAKDWYEKFIELPDAVEFTKVDKIRQVSLPKLTRPKRRKIVSSQDKPIHLTIFLILASIFIWGISKSDNTSMLANIFTWNSFAIQNFHQYWRIFTPAIVHFDFLHLAFN